MRMTTSPEVRMRVDDQENQGAMWSYVPMEQRIPADHPLRVMRPLVDAVLRELSPRFAELYSRVGRPSDRAREAAARAAVAGAVHDPQRAAADGATRLQPAVSLVRGSGDGRPRLERHGVHQEPRAAARGGDRPRILRPGGGPSAGARTALR